MVSERSYDAVIVGAGHNGLACATHLASRGWRVAVFEAKNEAGGAVKTGMHINLNNEPSTRLGLTAMQLFKVPVNKFGTNSMETGRQITEIVA